MQSISKDRLERVEYVRGVMQDINGEGEVDEANEKRE